MQYKLVLAKAAIGYVFCELGYIICDIVNRRFGK